MLNKYIRSVVKLFCIISMSMTIALSSWGQVLNTSRSVIVQNVAISSKDKQGINKAIVEYMKVHTEVPPAAVNIIISKRQGNFVMAQVVPTKPITDKVAVYLKHSAKGWHVLSLGTSFDKKFYKKYHIPQSLWLK